MSCKKIETWHYENVMNILLWSQECCSGSYVFKTCVIQYDNGLFSAIDV